MHRMCTSNEYIKNDGIATTKKISLLNEQTIKLNESMKKQKNLKQ